METEQLPFQHDLETFFKYYCDICAKDQSGQVNALCKPVLVDYDAEKKTVCLSYHVQDWMRNPSGVMHGGMVSTVFDLTMGLLSCYFSGKLTPTTDMQVTFLRPIPVGETLMIEAYCNLSGKTLCSVTARSWLASAPDKLTATGSGTYYAGSKNHKL